MSGPLHILKHEHRVIEQALRALNGICVRLESGESIPSETLSQIVDFISGFADRFHHGKEERYLFPALARQGIPRQSGCLGVMEHEHEVERELVTGLLRAISSYKAGSAEARALFVDSARRYTNTLISHVQKEDNILFRLAEEVLDESDMEAIKAGFKRAEAELGAGSVDGYEMMARELEERWSV